MSKYLEIRCAFRNLDSLRKALADCGVSFNQAANPRVPDLPMVDYVGQQRPERGSIVIGRDWVNKNWSGGLSNDLGFAWNGKEYAAIISEYDEGKDKVQAGMNQLRQRYGYHESMRLLRSKGYTVKETVSAGGQIRVTFAKR